MTTPRRLISFDWALKRLLRSKANFGILEGFLSELLHDDIHIVEILESETNKDDFADKHNRVDLKVRNARGELLLIEVQYEREWDYLQRILYATSKTLVEHLGEGAPYATVPKVISVNILYFDLGQGEDYVYVGRTDFRGLHKADPLALSPQQRALFPERTDAGDLFPEYYLIKVNQFDDIARDALDEWIFFLKNEEIRDGFTARGLAEAKTKLDIMKLPEAERRAYARWQEDLRYQASLVLSNYGVGKLEGHKEGLEEGRKEGLEEGRKEGLEEGRKEGLEQGRQGALQEIARRMRAEGAAPDRIVALTGLSAEEIAKL